MLQPKRLPRLMAACRTYEGGAFHFFPQEADLARLFAATAGEHGYATSLTQWERRGEVHTVVGVGKDKAEAEQVALTFMLDSTF